MKNSATYSLEDDKIRIYPEARFDAETYAEVKSLGYGWAPMQKCFFATWSTRREDLAIKLCGEISEDETSLNERAEERAERFETYSKNRENDADIALKTAHDIVDAIPFGQPILVGHHSERRNRNALKKADNAMRKSCENTEKAKYWQYRSNGVLNNATRKESPEVIARRVKKLEAEKRKMERNLAKTKPEYCERYNRWIAHFDKRLEFEKSRLAEQGKSNLLDKQPRPKQLPILNYPAPEGIAIESIHHAGKVSIYPQKSMTKAEYSVFYESNKGTRLVDGSHRVRIVVKYSDGKLERCAVLITDAKMHKTPPKAIKAA